MESEPTMISLAGERREGEEGAEADKSLRGPVPCLLPGLMTFRGRVRSPQDRVREHLREFAPCSAGDAWS